MSLLTCGINKVFDQYGGGKVLLQVIILENKDILYKF